MSVSLQNRSEAIDGLDGYEDLIDHPTDEGTTTTVAHPSDPTSPEVHESRFIEVEAEMRSGVEVDVSSSTSTIRTRVLEGLLRMADSYRRDGSLRQAIEMYFELVHDHDGTVQSGLAEERLFEIAREYEMVGELRQARGIYEHLL